MRRRSIVASSKVSVLIVVALLILIVPSMPADAQFGGGNGFNLGSFNFGGGCGFQSGFNQGGSFQGGGGFNQGGCFNQGGFNAPSGTNTGGGFNQGGGFQAGCGGFNFGGGGFQFGGSGINLGSRPGCGTGVFGLIPDVVRVEPGVRIPYRLVWISPTVWQDLELLDLRIREENGNVVALVRWVQATEEFQLLDPATGQIQSRGTARGRGTLESAFLRVVLSDTFSENSGETGQAVGLSIAVSLKPSPVDRVYGVDIGAKSDTGTLTYEIAGLLSVLGDSQRGLGVVNDDDDKPRKLTEEQRQQKERGNRASLDDYRTEGSALASDCAADIPTVTIANRDGSVVLRLLHDAGESCSLVKPGDYVEAVGEKQHEQLYDVDQVTVRRSGTRVR